MRRPAFTRISQFKPNGTLLWVGAGGFLFYLLLISAFGVLTGH